MEFALDLFLNIMTAIFAAWLAVRISIRKFSSQKWWEKKEETYARIIGTLSSLMGLLGNWEEHSLKIRRLKQEDIINLYKQFDIERGKIELIAREGAFRISENSSAALNIVTKTFYQYADHDDIEGIEAMSKAVSDCLKTITLEAKRDLKID